MGGQPGKPKPIGNPPIRYEPQRPPIEEPPKPIPPPPVERPPLPAGVLVHRIRRMVRPPSARYRSPAVLTGIG